MKPAEILEKENICVEEHAPFCMAECPVHFDARNMNILIEKGDYKSAYEQYQKAVLFPNVVSSSCKAPCEKKCKRGEAGESIKIRELECAITLRGKYKIEIQKSDIKIAKKLAIVEDVLDSMAIIYTLLGKGYSPDLFTSKQEIKTVDDDFDFLKDERITKYTDKKLDKALI